MKTAVALLLSCAAFCCAQDVKQPQDAKPDVNVEGVKRLQSVTWDLSTHKLVWLVEKGNVVQGEFVPTSRVKYQVSPDDAFMEFAGDKRYFGEDEAAAVHQLLDLLSLYCVESVVWWDHGESESPTPTPGLITKPKQPEPKPSIAPGVPVKVGEQTPEHPSRVRNTESSAARAQ
jgi:hypothetical protein